MDLLEDFEKKKKTLLLALDLYWLVKSLKKIRFFFFPHPFRDSIVFFKNY
jgi:hypothetical protein